MATSWNWLAKILRGKFFYYFFKVCQEAIVIDQNGTISEGCCDNMQICWGASYPCDAPTDYSNGTCDNYLIDGAPNGGNTVRDWCPQKCLRISLPVPAWKCSLSDASNGHLKWDPGWSHG